MNTELKGKVIFYAFGYLNTVPDTDKIDMEYLPSDMQSHFQKIKEANKDLKDSLKKYNKDNIPDELLYKIVGLAINYLNREIKMYDDQILMQNLSGKDHPYVYIRNIFHNERLDLQEWWTDYQNKCISQENTTKIDIGGGRYIIAEQNIDPYEDEIVVFINNNGNIQDLARISLNDWYDNEGNRRTIKDIISIKVYADNDSEGFTDKLLIQINEDK